MLRSITRHKGYVKGTGTLSYKDVKPIAGVIGDYGAIVVAKNSPIKNFKDAVDQYQKDPKSIKMAGGSVRGSMDHLIGALANAPIKWSMLPLTDPPAILIDFGSF